MCHACIGSCRVRATFVYDDSGASRTDSYLKDPAMGKLRIKPFKHNTECETLYRYADDDDYSDDATETSQTAKNAKSTMLLL